MLDGGFLYMANEQHIPNLRYLLLTSSIHYQDVSFDTDLEQTSMGSQKETPKAWPNPGNQDSDLMLNDDMKRITQYLKKQETYRILRSH